MQQKPFIRELILFGVAATGLLLTYHWIFAGYFPAANGGVGHDYSYFFPGLLDGYYWYLNNGAFSTPWFTAAFCGGVPVFANPSNLYFSVPQWLSFGTDPLSAVYITMLGFALAGFGGFYLLLRLCFHTSVATALLGATLFMFNGFFASRMLIGHLTFHAFMLTPLIACLLLYHEQTPRLSGRLFRGILAGVLFAYVIHSGGVQVILPIILAVMAIGLIHGLRHAEAGLFWLSLAGAGLIGITLALAKLSASLAFLDNFTRTDYQLPGAGSLWGLIKLSFETLFLEPSGATVQSVLTNVQWPPARHEFEYGITLVPLVMLLLAVPFLLRGNVHQPHLGRAQWLQLAALLVLLLIPLAVNYYTPGWNAVLKEIPIIRSSSILFRWLCIYIPIIILAAALAFDRAEALQRLRPYLVALGIVAVVLTHAYTSRDYYANQTYNPTPIVDAYDKAQAEGKPITIDSITVFKDQNGRVAMPVFRNNTLVNGRSQLACYEPIFGYRLEHFPLQQMRPGPVQQVIDGHFNLKNPACYLFGESNDCTPGDHFAVDQADAAKALTRYQPFEFKLPWWQQSANSISLVMLVAVVLFLLGYPLLRQKRLRNNAREQK